MASGVVLKQNKNGFVVARFASIGVEAWVVDELSKQKLLKQEE